jgi:hypothetical protein
VVGVVAVADDKIVGVVEGDGGVGVGDDGKEVDREVVEGGGEEETDGVVGGGDESIVEGAGR